MFYSVLEPISNDLSKVVNSQSTSGMASPFDLTSFRASNSLGINSNGIYDHVDALFSFQTNSKRSREEGIFFTVLRWHRKKLDFLTRKSSDEDVVSAIAWDVETTIDSCVVLCGGST